MARVTALNADTRSALESLADETRRLFYRLRAASAHAHGGNDVTAGLRGVMQAIADGGAQTVPQMARARLVSRQHIQVLVDELAERRLVELVNNPAHKRSKLVRLSTQGRKVFERMRRRERRVFDKLDLAVAERELRKAARVLRSVSDTLDGVEY
ncbi:MAG: MarR family winged helix-turn-helix transcriptional regulator [Vicinamibacterales bacterium]